MPTSKYCPSKDRSIQACACYMGHWTMCWVRTESQVPAVLPLVRILLSTCQPSSHVPPACKFGLSLPVHTWRPTASVTHRPGSTARCARTASVLRGKACVWRQQYYITLAGVYSFLLQIPLLRMSSFRRSRSWSLSGSLLGEKTDGAD